MFDLIQGIFQGLTQNGSSVYMNNNGNGTYDVIVKGIFGQNQTNSGLDLSSAMDLINQLLGR